jgi:hypothetical protein
MPTLYLSQSDAVAENHPDVFCGDEPGSLTESLELDGPVTITYDTVRDIDGEIVLTMDAHGLWKAPNGRLYSDVTIGS